MSERGRFWERYLGGKDPPTQKKGIEEKGNPKGSSIGDVEGMVLLRAIDNTGIARREGDGKQRVLTQGAAAKGKK